jgi:hypothetical protein
VPLSPVRAPTRAVTAAARMGGIRLMTSAFTSSNSVESFMALASMALARLPGR